MWWYTISIWQVKMHLHLQYTGKRLPHCAAVYQWAWYTKVGVRETWPGCLVIEMHVLSCQKLQTNIYSLHLNSFWQLRAPGTTNKPKTTNSFDSSSIANQSKSMCLQMQSLVPLQSHRDCEDFSIGSSTFNVQMFNFFYIYLIFIINIIWLWQRTLKQTQQHL